MTFAIRFVAAVLVAVGAVSVSAPVRAADDGMSPSAMLALSAEAADAKAKRDLLSILQPAGKFRKDDGVNPGVTMRTVPRGTVMKGLCVSDELGLRYRPTRAAPDPGNAPRRLAGLDLSRVYHANPSVAYVPDTAGIERKRPVGDLWAADCQALRSNRTASWFLARNDEDAATTVEVFLAAMEALRTGQVRAERCAHALKNGESCTQAILRAARVDKIDVAGDSGPCGDGRSCFNFYFDDAEDWGLGVVFVPGRNYPISSKDIASITVSETEPVD